MGEIQALILHHDFLLLLLLLVLFLLRRASDPGIRRLPSKRAEISAKMSVIKGRRMPGRGVAPRLFALKSGPRLLTCWP
jgi:hypothetical protein